MRKLRKIFFIVSGILAILGIVLISVGASKGGVEKLARDFSNNVFAFDFDNENTEGMNDLTNKEITFSKQEVSSIVLNGKYGEYEIEVWDRAEYSVQGIQGSGYIKYSLNNGELKISTKGDFLSDLTDAVKAKIYIPKDAELSSASFNVGAGTITCGNINATDLFITVGAGEGYFYNINATTTKFNIGAGECNVENVNFTNCEFKIGVGEFDLQGNIEGNVDVQCGTGNVDMELLNLYNEFDYAVKVGIGSVRVGKELSPVTDSNINLDNNAEKTMSIKCGIGDVSVEFAK